MFGDGLAVAPLGAGEKKRALDDICEGVYAGKRKLHPFQLWVLVEKYRELLRCGVVGPNDGPNLWRKLRQLTSPSFNCSLVFWKAFGLDCYP
jgi:hypothetical protein